MTEEKMTIKKWFENYWYYYKYHTIIVVFLTVTFSVAIAQCAGRKTADYNLVLATQNGIFTEKQIELIETEFAKYGEDLNGDGQVTVSVTDCSFNQSRNDYELQKVKRQKLQLAVMSDWRSQIFLTDEASFHYIENLGEGGFLVDLGLTDNGGKSFILTNTNFFKSAEKTSGSSLPKGLRVSRRIVGDTIIAQNKNALAMQQSCDKLVKAFVKANNR